MIKDRRIVIKYFAGYEKLGKSAEPDDPKWQQGIEKLKACEALMLRTCASVQVENPTQILKVLQDSPVLTIGKQSVFLSLVA